MLPQLRDLRSPLDSPRLQALVAGLGEHDAQPTLLAQALVEQPPVLARDGGVFADDYDAELSELRRLSTHAAQFIVDLEQHEREATGISTLKAAYLPVHGYYPHTSTAPPATARPTPHHPHNP